MIRLARHLPAALALVGASALATMNAASAQGARAPSPERQAQEAACGGDAQRFCGPYIPDEQKIAACLKQNRAKLTPACARIIP